MHDQRMKLFVYLGGKGYSLYSNNIFLICAFKKILTVSVNHSYLKQSLTEIFCMQERKSFQKIILYLSFEQLSKFGKRYRSNSIIVSVIINQIHEKGRTEAEKNTPHKVRQLLLVIDYLE